MPPPSPLLPDLLSSWFAITHRVWQSPPNMHLFGARVSRLYTENQCSLFFTLELVLPRRTPFWGLDLGLLEITLGRRREWIFFLQWRILSSWTLLGISPNLITRGYMQCGRPGAAVKDLSLQGGPVFHIPYPLLLTSVNWDKFPDFSEPLYPQLWDENPNDKGTGLKMLPRGTVWSLLSLIPNGPKLEYYFSIFGIHIITTLGSIFLIQNSTLYDNLSLPVHQICLGGHRVGCGTLTARQEFLLLRYLHNCHTDIYVGHTCIFKFQQQ